MLASRRTLAVFSALFATACGDGLGPSRSPAQPVIVILLTAGQQTHPVTATWSIPAESSAALLGSQRPIGSTDLVLSVRGPDGSETLPEPVSTTPGLYSLRMSVVPGEEYRLSGSVAGRPIAASCRVPLEAVFIEPAGGVFRLKVNQPGPTFRIRSAGTALVLFSNGANFLQAPSDTVGVFLPFGFPAEGLYGADVETWERAAAGYFFREDWVTNLTGAVGVFGARTSRQMIFEVE